jgi:hypothetical protein
MRYLPTWLPDPRGEQHDQSPVVCAACYGCRCGPQERRTQAWQGAADGSELVEKDLHEAHADLHITRGRVRPSGLASAGNAPGAGDPTGRPAGHPRRGVGTAECGGDLRDVLLDGAVASGGQFPARQEVYRNHGTNGATKPTGVLRSTPALLPVAKPSTADTIHAGSRGCVLGATVTGLFPRGLGRSARRPRVRSLLSRSMGHRPLGVPQRRSSRSSLPPRRSGPTAAAPPP